MKELMKIEANRVVEIELRSTGEYKNPFMDVTLDVEFVAPSGDKKLVPAFWAGEKTWKVRYASPETGTHAYKTICSDEEDTGLHDVTGELEVTPYSGDNPLYRHGFLRIAADNRHFEHEDGTPFLWLADTWWKCLSKRMSLDDFRELAADRAEKGFSVVQIVCGPYPDEDHFQESWKNEAGFPYLKEDFSEVNPEYWEYADKRIFHLVEAGLSPAIVGSWGRNDCEGMKLVGLEGMKRHWRYLIARYGALPTTWIVAGEAQGELWTACSKYVRELDFIDRPTTVHPHDSGRASVTDESCINFDMLQTGHGGTTKVAIEKFNVSCGRKPAMPVLIGEHSYEQHMQTGYPDVQRYIFWASMLSGAAGLTYGAAGIWHAGIKEDYGTCYMYDRTTWQEGMTFEGATHIGNGKKFLEKYDWQRFEPHPEWTRLEAYAAGIPGEIRFIYTPVAPYNWAGPLVKGLEPNIPYRAYYYDPVRDIRDDRCIVINKDPVKGEKNANPFTDGRKHAESDLKPDDVIEVDGRSFVGPPKPSPQDWVFVLERA